MKKLAICNHSLRSWLGNALQNLNDPNRAATTRRGWPDFFTAPEGAVCFQDFLSVEDEVEDVLVELESDLVSDFDDVSPFASEDFAPLSADLLPPRA